METRRSTSHISFFGDRNEIPKLTQISHRASTSLRSAVLDYSDGRLRCLLGHVIQEYCGKRAG